MRARFKPWAKEKLLNHPELYIQSPEKNKGKWAQIFGNCNPIHIEIGSGKGRFITQVAQKFPENNYIGIEIVESVLVSVLDKALVEKTSNLRLLSINGAELSHYFEPGEINRIYLNFSDPWPKKRHAKRRLTHPDFLAVYKHLLKKGGEIHFKTDNRSLFEFSLVTFSACNLQLKKVSLDLHQDDVEENIMTEYEEKFCRQGLPIYRLEAIAR